MDKLEIKEAWEKWSKKSGVRLWVEPIEYTCVICGDELLEFHWEWKDNVYDCRICGGPHAVIDKRGEERCTYFAGGEYLAMTDEAEDAPFCGWCEENFHSHPDGTVTVYLDDGEKFSARYNGPLLHDPEIDGGLCYEGLSESVKGGIKEIVGGSRWVSTDAWRGYTQPGVAEAWERVCDGWVGWGSGGRPGVKFLNNLNQYAMEWEVSIICVAATTSNVLSTGVDVYVEGVRAEEVRGRIEGMDLSFGGDGHLGVR